MSDKLPEKRGRGRPPKNKSNNINTSLNELLNIPSTQSVQNSLNSIIANQPDDIESLINHINEKELAMAIDESYASNLSVQINSSSIIKNNIMDINSSFENININININVEDDNDTEMAIIMAEIKEREEQERLDSELAMKLSKDLGNPIYEDTNNTSYNNEDNEQEDNEQYDKYYDKVEDCDSLIRYNGSCLEDENIVSSTSDIRKMQDFEYEQSLLKDIVKEKNRIKNQINIEPKVVEKKKDYIEDDVKDDLKHVVKDNNEIAKPLTANELRNARLAFFNKK
jgi:hypothetical protein